MKELKEIQEIMSQIKLVHSSRISEQRIDDTYYRDTFAVPHVQTPYTVIRLGTGADLVDTPVNHIVTSYPKVYTSATDTTDKAVERAAKRGALLNHWAAALSRENPQPFRLFAKNLLSRGEGWIRVLNRDSEMPLQFDILEPMVVFGSPNEIDGVPEFVVIEYERDYRSVQFNWKYWNNPKRRKGNDYKVKWREYWDGDVKYQEADGQPVTGVDEDGERFSDGVIKNIFGFVPFVHEYSGYGVPDERCSPESLAVSRLRYVRGRILEETEAESYLASQLKLHSVGRVNITSLDPNNQQPPDVDYDLSVGAKNFIPYGVKVDENMGAEPSGAIFNHIYTIRNYIEKANPSIMQGIGSGTSGRQEDIYSKHALAQYDSIVNNTSNAFAKAFELGLKICEKVNAYPLSVRGWKVKNGQRIRDYTKVEKEDIDDYTCEFKLKAADPLEDKAQSLEGDREQQAGIIDWETNLIKYKGYSQDEAREIMDKAIVDKIILNNPMLLEVLAKEAMTRLGLEKYMEQPQQGGIVPKSQPVPGMPGRDGGAPREGNIQSSDAYKEADMLLQGYKVRERAG